MKDDLFSLIQSTKSPIEVRNQVREYLQALDSMAEILRR